VSENNNRPCVWKVLVCGKWTLPLLPVYFHKYVSENNNRPCVWKVLVCGKWTLPLLPVYFHKYVSENNIGSVCVCVSRGNLLFMYS
jgi:hypothetical protein